MREGDFVNVGDDEPAWDEVVALDPEDVASIRADPDLDDFLPNGRGLDEEDDEPDVEDDDPDFDDAEMSLLQDLGIDLDASDDPIGGLDLDLVLEPESESEDSADDDAAA
ncbi:MAG TPA: hypothetical protein VKP69_24350 [Isosphaeraceae bacterium]|nr:hypothetical protein [Isosphaeraceae bacterium]